MRLTAMVLLLLVACGGQPAVEPTAPGPDEPPATDAGEAALRGTFGGDARLEGGCSWVDDGSQRWEVLWPEGYEVTFDPLTLTTPDGQTVAEGDGVVVEGAEETEMMTVCQVGPVWQATGVRVE
ncbi:MAG TPA: hypothetical protein VM307_03755 [Egibacteraceae bacterium]|nr:hypothetical protein [Egibacteraceae bacterium]